MAGQVLFPSELRAPSKVAANSKEAITSKALMTCNRAGILIHGREIRAPVPVPPKTCMGFFTGTNYFAYFSRKIIGTKGW